MRLFKIIVLSAAVLDAALFLASPASPLATTSPTQTVGLSSETGELPLLTR